MATEVYAVPARFRFNDVYVSGTSHIPSSRLRPISTCIYLELPLAQHQKRLRNKTEETEFKTWKDPIHARSPILLDKWKLNKYLYLPCQSLQSPKTSGKAGLNVFFLILPCITDRD